MSPVDAKLATMTNVLDREMYTEAGAARLLRIAQPTLHYWLEGGERRGKRYKPVIRTEATGAKNVTWAEFVEAGLLRQYRRNHNVPMLELRLFIESLRDRLGVPYPLAHAMPFVTGRKLVLEAQAKSNLTGDFALVAEVGGQYLLLSAAQQFYERVTWEDDVAAKWRPDDNEDSPVIVDPDVRFGSPSIGGIRTEVIWEQQQAGEDDAELANAFNLSIPQVRWALSYEMANRAA
jgi:uncharacterized protein (DUF433 family)